MPKISIREFDFTTPGTSDYSNFAVVVPGIVPKWPGETVDDDNEDETAAKALFDDNGIAEITAANFTDFESLIGLGNASVVGSGESQAAEPPTVSPISDVVGSGVILSADNFENYKNWATGSTSYKLYAEEEKEEDDPAYGDAGYLQTEEAKYILASSYSAEATYVYIERGKEGNDAFTSGNIIHCGNQIAYELLKLGYTVLYKKINATSSVDAGTKRYMISTDDYATFCDYLSF